MKLSILKTFLREIIHYADERLVVSSTGNEIFQRNEINETKLYLPISLAKSILGSNRLSRRLFRLDKSNVVPVGENLVIIHQGIVFHWSHKTNSLKPTLSLQNCRNLLHQSMAITDDSTLYFGEYGANSDRKPVHIYRSRDGGRSWEIAFTFQAGLTRHVHSCCWDDHEQKLWIFCGDFDGECHIVCADREFRDLEWIGDGTQTYRACNAFFEKDAVHWIMDSQLEDCYHIRLDRNSRAVAKMNQLPGPVWYSKLLSDGYYLAATTQELGRGVKDKFAHLLLSLDLEKWETICRFRHDKLPKKYFKFGVIGFADGMQTSQAFYMFGEAIRGLDGKAALCRIEK